MPGAEFDAYASRYEADLARGLALTGESQDFFARGRVAWVGRRLAHMGAHPRRVLDFGCGTGTSLPLLRDQWPVDEVVGLDPSEASLVAARERFGSSAVRLIGGEELGAQPAFDLVFTNGVFHHILPEHRDRAMVSIAAALRPGGLFALWENNPWNPGTRWIMRRVAFDRDAILLTPGECRRRCREAGLEVVGIDHLFVFPKSLGWLRWLEPLLARLPIGGQYLVLARKPER